MVGDAIETSDGVASEPEDEDEEGEWEYDEEAGEEEESKMADSKLEVSFA